VIQSARAWGPKSTDSSSKFLGKMAEKDEKREAAGRIKV
jgi:hypothetical protein